MFCYSIPNMQRHYNTGKFDQMVQKIEKEEEHSDSFCKVDINWFQTYRAHTHKNCGSSHLQTQMLRANFTMYLKNAVFQLC